MYTVTIYFMTQLLIILAPLGKLIPSELQSKLMNMAEAFINSTEAGKGIIGKLLQNWNGTIESSVPNEK
jgi:hypothetical protein